MIVIEKGSKEVTEFEDSKRVNIDPDLRETHKTDSGEHDFSREYTSVEEGYWEPIIQINQNHIEENYKKIVLESGKSNKHSSGSSERQDRISGEKVHESEEDMKGDYNGVYADEVKSNATTKYNLVSSSVDFEQLNDQTHISSINSNLETTTKSNVALNLSPLYVIDYVKYQTPVPPKSSTAGLEKGNPFLKTTIKVDEKSISAEFGYFTQKPSTSRDQSAATKDPEFFHPTLTRIEEQSDLVTKRFEMPSDYNEYTLDNITVNSSSVEAITLNETDPKRQIEKVSHASSSKKIGAEKVIGIISSSKDNDLVKGDVEGGANIQNHTNKIEESYELPIVESGQFNNNNYSTSEHNLKVSGENLIRPLPLHYNKDSQMKTLESISSGESDFLTKNVVHANKKFDLVNLHSKEDDFSKHYTSVEEGYWDPDQIKTRLTRNEETKNTYLKQQNEYESPRRNLHHLHKQSGTETEEKDFSKHYSSVQEGFWNGNDNQVSSSVLVD